MTDLPYKRRRANVSLAHRQGVQNGIAQIETLAVGTSAVSISSFGDLMCIDLGVNPGRVSLHTEKAITVALRVIQQLLEIEPRMDKVYLSSGTVLAVLADKKPCPTECNENLKFIQKHKKLEFDFGLDLCLRSRCLASLLARGVLVWEQWSLHESLLLDTIEKTVGIDMVREMCGREVKSIFSLTREEVSRLDLRFREVPATPYAENEILLHSHVIIEEAPGAIATTQNAA
ncbi:MAG: hypothetical protein HC933_04470 [Pleurocapsa sp. SU_196_0]|nr:hypothetical protein [Pleurocapsa sp. SU_196_0]